MNNTKLKLYFRDEKASSKQISIDYPHDSYDDNTLSKAMDAIIGSKVLVTKNGPVASKYKAETETITRTSYNI